MIDLKAEQPISLRAAAELPELRINGRAPNIATVYRWVSTGVRGRKLESAVIGGSRVTTEQAVQRWIAALTNPDVAIRPPTSTARRRESEKSVRELVEAGFEVGGPAER